jgi:FlaA1/EpsC-like NDP-sugar epimerase
VTVTHPEMRRFFMTIPEAVQLVLQAGAIGRGGELFMLDMGEPVKIVDLARDLIGLSGLEVGTDIEIQFTGMRPGEKLYEEMFFDHELAAPTEHPKVLRARDQLEPWGLDLINDLVASALQGVDDDEIRRQLRNLVPDFTPDPCYSATPTENVSVPTPAAIPLAKTGTDRHVARRPERRVSGQVIAIGSRVGGD